IVVLESPPVDHVRYGISVVVDVDVVVHVGGERVEVRPAGWTLERDPVADEHHRVRGALRHVRVEVRAVDLGIGRDQRSFAVARGDGRRGAEPREQPRDQCARAGHCYGGRAETLAMVMQGETLLSRWNETNAAA